MAVFPTRVAEYNCSSCRYDCPSDVKVLLTARQTKHCDHYRRLTSSVMRSRVWDEYTQKEIAAREAYRKAVSAATDERDRALEAMEQGDAP